MQSLAVLPSQFKQETSQSKHSLAADA